MEKETILRSALLLIVMLTVLPGFSQTNHLTGMKVVNEMGCSFSCPEEMEQMKSFDGETNKEEGSGFLTVGGKISLTDAIVYEIDTDIKHFSRKEAQALLNEVKKQKGTKILKQQITNDGLYYESVVNNPEVSSKTIHYASRLLVKGKKSLMLMISWTNEPIISKNKDAIIRSMKVE